MNNAEDTCEYRGHVDGYIMHSITAEDICKIRWCTPEAGLDHVEHMEQDTPDRE